MQDFSPMKSEYLHICQKYFFYHSKANRFPMFPFSPRNLEDCSVMLAVKLAHYVVCHDLYVEATSCNKVNMPVRLLYHAVKVRTRSETRVTSVHTDAPLIVPAATQLKRQLRKNSTDPRRSGLGLSLGIQRYPMPRNPPVPCQPEDSVQAHEPETKK